MSNVPELDTFETRSGRHLAKRNQSQSEAIFLKQENMKAERLITDEFYVHSMNSKEFSDSK